MVLFKGFLQITDTQAQNFPPFRTYTLTPPGKINPKEFEWKKKLAKMVL